MTKIRKYRPTGETLGAGRAWRATCPNCEAEFTAEDLARLGRTNPRAVERRRDWLIFDTPCCGYKTWFLLPVVQPQLATRPGEWANVRLPFLLHLRVRSLAKRDDVTTGELIEAALCFFVARGQSAATPKRSSEQFWGGVRVHTQNKESAPGKKNGQTSNRA